MHRQADDVAVREYLKEQRCYLLYYLPFEMTVDNFTKIFDKYFIYVGLTEDLQTSVNVLAEKLGLSSISVRHLNTSVHDEEVLEEMREEYTKNHPLEYTIYEYVLEHYKK